MAHADFAMKPASAVFIDIPNIATVTRRPWQKLPWKRLSQEIARSEVLMGTSLMHAAAYVSGWGNEEKLRAYHGIDQMTFGRGIQLKIRSDDDVDSMIIDDMWATISQQMVESVRDGVLSLPLQVRFIIVSGDSDYLRTIRKMRDTYGRFLELEFYVFSWISNLSNDLRESANRCTYLDSVRGFNTVPMIRPGRN